MNEIMKHHEKMRALKSNENYENNKSVVTTFLTLDHSQFKCERISAKVEKVIEKVGANPAPNIYQRRQGQSLTPLIEGKIQYAKMKKDFSIEQVRLELRARGLADNFTADTSWTTLIKILKEHEKDKKSFRPITNYHSFKRNSTYFDADGEVI